MEENILKFDENNLFNSEILQQYDRDGQLGLMGYLLRNEKWEIVDNQIVFPEIQTEEKIQKSIEKYNLNVKKSLLQAKREVINLVFVLGYAETKTRLDKERDEIESKEKENKGLER